MAFLQTGRSQTEIAGTLNRSKSTISREIYRNSFEGKYDPCDAQVTATARRKFAKKATKQSPEVLQIVRKWLRIGWSPESISCRFYVEFPLQKHVCHTTIYDWIDKDMQKGGKLYTYLPRYGKRRWKGGKRKRAGVSLIPNRVDISERPPIVNERKRIGDWEGDTVYGQNASLVTLVERTSRFTLCGRTQTKCKDEVASVINGLFDTITGRKKTLTLDNGSEFAAHDKIKKRHSIDVFFAKPYASWQRGTNENTNGRLRRLWPKKFDIATLSQE
ncbi:MAG: IS30 family transposase, partial [Desulforhopalus sp.]|nr:IS30 family transposase [Desulforhopalus sp.]